MLNEQNLLGMDSNSDLPGNWLHDFEPTIPPLWSQFSKYLRDTDI